MPRAQVDEPGAGDVVAAVELVVSTLSPRADDAATWDAPAGRLRWTSREALAHVADCQLWYAGSLARRSSAAVEVPEVPRDTEIPKMLDEVRTGGALLAAVVRAAGSDDRAWHAFGIADRSGFAAMGCDEALVHGWDIATGMGLTLDPPKDLCERVLRRLFPGAPAGHDSWALLLWLNGRQDLNGEPPERRWKFHCAPLAEWTG